MRKTAFVCAMALVWALAAPYSAAEDAAPDVLLQKLTLEVMAIIRHEKDIQAANPSKTVRLVEARILPLFEFTRMTELAVARNWRLATAQQKKALTKEFRGLLVRTYFTALSSSRDQVIEFQRLRAAPGDTDVTVKSILKLSGTESLTMDYDMEKKAAGWKVYNIKIDGVSLVTTYRETFAGEVREGGVDGLIKTLADNNRRAAASLPSRQTQGTDFSAIVRSVLQGGQ